MLVGSLAGYVQVPYWNGYVIDLDAQNLLPWWLSRKGLLFVMGWMLAAVMLVVSWVCLSAVCPPSRCVDSRDEEALQPAAGIQIGTDRIVSRRCACQHCHSPLWAGVSSAPGISPGHGSSSTLFLDMDSFWHCGPCLLRVFRPILLSFKPPRIAVIHFSDEAFFHDGVPSGNRIAGQLEVVCQTVRDKATQSVGQEVDVFQGELWTS